MYQFGRIDQRTQIYET